MNTDLLLNGMDIAGIFKDLTENGATSRRILAEGFRKNLLAEAMQSAYTPLPEQVGNGENRVRQQSGQFIDFAENSRFMSFKNHFQAWLHEHLKKLAPYPFESPLLLNSGELLRYEAGSLGITPHRDGNKYKNLICVIVLGGQGKFFVCSDRSGREAREIDASPGNVILMKAPGFLGQQERPFHFVRDIRETRYVLGLRQEISRSKG